MELREAIEEIEKAGTRYFSQSSDLAKSVILEAIIDGTLIPANQTVKVDDDKLWQAMNDGYAHYEDFKRDVLSTLIPAEQCFSVREGYSASAFKNVDLEEGVGYSEDVPLTEALEIRSADDVRREAFREALDLFESRPDAVKVIRALIDTPQHKGGDDE